MPQQYHLPLPQTEAMSLEDFLPSSANEEAVRWLLSRAPQEWPSHAMVLWGPAGSGKTHLLTIWRDKVGAVSVRLGDNTVLDAIVQGQTVAAAYVIDDADRCAADPVLQEWLQHFYNATKTAGANVLLTASKPPAAWGLGLRDIETRLKSCLTVGLQEPDDELTRGLLLKLFADRQLLVETGVIEYLAQRVERSGGAIRQVVAALDTAALERGRKISIPFAQSVLGQSLSSQD